MAKGRLLTLRIEDAAIGLARRYLKKKYPGRPITRAGWGEGCDLKVGNDIYVEIKSTRRTKITNYTLSRNEFFSACKHKKFILLLINTVSKEIIQIGRDDFLANCKPTEPYFKLSITKLREKTRKGASS